MVTLRSRSRPLARGVSGAGVDRSADRSRLRRLTVGLAGLGSAILAFFHLALLWQRVASQSLLEPAVLLRWLGSVLLLAALVYLRRAGVPLLWGRRAAVFWLLVLLLHVGIPAASAVQAGGHAPGSAVLLALPVALSPVLSALLVAIALERWSRLRPRPVRLRRRTPERLRLARSGHAPSVLSRPPPALVQL